MKQNNKIKEIEEVLAHFGRDKIAEVMGNMQEKELPVLKTKDLPDPGSEIKEGTDSCVAYEDLDYLERIIDRRNFLPASFLEEGAITQKAVARIAFRESYGGFRAGDGWATGFMVSPSLLLTNNHVISSKSFAKKLVAQFNYQNDLSGNPLAIDAYTFDPDDVFYTNRNLDCTLIRVNKKCYYSFSKFNLDLLPETVIDREHEYTPNPLDPIDRGINIGQPNIPLGDWVNNWGRVCTFPGKKWGFVKLKKRVKYTKNQFLNIVQHPRARRKEVALQENTITNIFSNKIRYTTDTEPGSSGSPVFNNFWDVVALHHAAGEWDNSSNKWISNQGIRIDKIIKALHTNYDGTIAGRKILSELGIL